MQTVSLRSSGMHRKQNFAFPPPLFFRFSCLIFFPLAEDLVGFILVGGAFRKAFRILGYGERKGRWAMFRSMLHGFCPFFPVSLTELCSFWYGRKDVDPHGWLQAAQGRMG